ELSNNSSYCYYEGGSILYNYPALCLDKFSPYCSLTNSAHFLTFDGANNTPYAPEKQTMLSSPWMWKTSLPTTSLPTQAQCAKKSQGDANCDGLIDNNDFTVWQDEFKHIASTLSSDFNNDGKVTLLDFNIWKDTLRTSPSTTPNLTALPLPTKSIK